MGCKGITVYRDGSRDGVIVLANDKAAPADALEVKEKKPRTRPKKTTGFTFLMHTGCGKMYVTINEDERGACEVFTQLGKSGGCTSSQSEAIARLISLSLRSGIDQQDIIDQLKGIRCPSPTLAEGGAILSCADAVAKALEAYMKEKSAPALFEHELSRSEPYAEIPHSSTAAVSGGYPAASGGNNISGSCPQCPECGEMLTFSEGCAVCRDCGYSKCW
jgi:ribonucleoside-diphosphate reductase alpha chain